MIIHLCKYNRQRVWYSLYDPVLSNLGCCLRVKTENKKRHKYKLLFILAIVWYRDYDEWEVLSLLVSLKSLFEFDTVL